MIDFSDWVAKELVAELLGPNPELVNPELVDPDGTADPLGTQVEVPDPAPVVDQVEEDDLDAIDTDSMYMLLILQRQKRFNLVEVLRNLEIPSGGKAHMNIPLCRMASLQVVRPALINDIQKLQVDFVHGYRVGAVVFYVLLTNMRGEGSMVSDVDRARDREFEAFLKADKDLCFMSNRLFYVWDGNHCLLAWTDHIHRVHRTEL
jgi:hypothetical protein